MKKSPLTTVLLMVLTVLSLWSVGLCYSYISKSRELRNLSAKVNLINYRQQALNSLAMDVAKYGETHPAIAPILESVGIKQMPATNKPASK